MGRTACKDVNLFSLIMPKMKKKKKKKSIEQQNKLMELQILL